MEIFLILVLAHILRNGVVDGIHGVTGRVPPRVQMVNKLLAERDRARKARGEKKASKWSSGRHAIREYGSALLNDAFDSARQRHDLRHKARLHRRKEAMWAIERGELPPASPTRKAARAVLDRTRDWYADRLDRAFETHDHRKAKRRDARAERRAHRENRRYDRRHPADQQPPIDSGPVPPADAASSEGQDQTPTPDAVHDAVQDPEPGAPDNPAERTTADYICPEPDCRGHHAAPPLVPCGDPDCDGVLVPTEDAHHDADGGVVIQTHCTAEDCGQAGTIYDRWDPPRTWTDPEGIAYDRGAHDAGIPPFDVPLATAHAYMNEADGAPGEEENYQYWRGYVDHHPNNPDRRLYVAPEEELLGHHHAERGMDDARRDAALAAGDPEIAKALAEDGIHVPQSPQLARERAAFHRSVGELEAAAYQDGYAHQRDRDLAAALITDSGSHGPVNPTESKGSPTVTATTGEVTGLMSALGYAAAMRTNCENQPTNHESAEAGLRAGGVGEDVIADFAAGAAMIAEAAAHYARGEAKLQAQIAGKEFYEANQSAGTREFLKTE